MYLPSSINLSTAHAETRESMNVTFRTMLMNAERWLELGANCPSVLYLALNKV